MSRIPRGASLVLACLMTAVLLTACSDDSAPRVSRDEGIMTLTAQGFSQRAAECAIDGAKQQDVDLLEVFARDQLTQREYDVMTAVGDFCVEEHGSTGTSVPPSDVPVVTGETSVSD